MRFVVRPGRRFCLALFVIGLFTVPADAQDLPLTGSWEGSYTCNQGKTGLKLVFSDADSAHGIFEFFAHPSNPSVPSGSFAVDARYADGGGIVIEPGGWIRRPDGYSTVGMHGQLRKGGTIFSGKIDFSGCSTFEVTRTSIAKPTRGAQPQETPAQLVMPLAD